jgi:hypothetical protein
MERMTCDKSLSHLKKSQHSRALSIIFIAGLALFSWACEENSGQGTGTDPNAGADEFMHVSAVVSLPCDIFLSSILQSEVVQCTFPETRDPLSLTQFLDDLNTAISGLGFEITDDSRIWIEALGGRGGKGANGTAGGGLRGNKGYARTATTIGHIFDNLLADGDSLYILIGERGQRKAGDGATGGASTVVIGQDILDVGDELDPVGELVLLIAGGGGGGGIGGSATGGKGGGGGDSVATLTANASVDGGNGSGGGLNGIGGNKDGEGGAGEGTDPGTAGIGGYGGRQTGREASDWGLDIVWADGHGGRAASSDEGGGGGGGFGGGGGAGHCKDNECGAGAGGGGSWARRATVENSVGSFLGKDSMPGNDDNGVVVMTIETFSN